MYRLPHGLVRVYYDFGPRSMKPGDMLTCFHHELNQKLEELRLEADRELNQRLEEIRQVFA